MRKSKKYYINDGLDGVIVAKTLKQAIGILCKANGFAKQEIRQYQKKIKKNPDYTCDTDWVIEEFKLKKLQKSELIGFCEW